MSLKVSYLLFLNIVTSHIVTYYVLLDALLSATYSVLVSGARVFAAVFSESLLTKVLLLKTGKLTVATDLAQCFIKLRFESITFTHGNGNIVIIVYLITNDTEAFFIVSEP